MEGCTFCRIIKGVAPASIVYFDEKAMAIMDIQPVNPGHVLIIPKSMLRDYLNLTRKQGHTCSRSHCESLKLLGGLAQNVKE